MNEKTLALKRHKKNLRRKKIGRAHRLQQISERKAQLLRQFKAPTTEDKA